MNTIANTEYVWPDCHLAWPTAPAPEPWFLVRALRATLDGLHVGLDMEAPRHGVEEGARLFLAWPSVRDITLEEVKSDGGVGVGIFRIHIWVNDAPELGGRLTIVYSRRQCKDPAHRAMRCLEQLCRARRVAQGLD